MVHWYCQFIANRKNIIDHVTVTSIHCMLIHARMRFQSLLLLYYLCYKLLFIVCRCQNVDLLQHELRHLVSLNNYTLPTALRRPLTNDTQNVQGIAISRSASECTACASLLEQHKTWLFSATLAVYITIPLRSTSLRSAICMARGGGGSISLVVPKSLVM